MGNDWWLKLVKMAYEKALAYLTQPAGGIGIIQSLGSGYSTEEDRMANAQKLREACDAAIYNPLFAPAGGVTHCNQAAQEIANAMGVTDIDGMMANEQAAALAGAPNWRSDTMERAAAHALKGGLAFAVLVDYPHGHITAIYPDPMEQSGSWACEVPIVANVGRENKRCKLSAAFRAEARPMVQFFLHGIV